MAMIIEIGDLAKYDTVNNRTDPETKGFVAGLYKDGSPAYVGYGSNGLCSKDKMPGRITTDLAKPGIYTPCDGDQFDSANVYYMLNHTNLVWKTTDSDAMRTLPGALTLVSSSGQPFMYGRNKINTYTQLGKVHNGNDLFGYWYTQDGKEYNTKSGYDVLTCDPPFCGSFHDFIQRTFKP